MTRSKRYARIRYARQANKICLTLDLRPSSSSGGGLIITELGPGASRSPDFSPVLEGGLKSPEPVSAFFCVRVLRVLRVVISGNANRRVGGILSVQFTSIQQPIGQTKPAEQTCANSACSGHVIKDQ